MASDEDNEESFAGKFHLGALRCLSVLCFFANYLGGTIPLTIGVCILGYLFFVYIPPYLSTDTFLAAGQRLRLMRRVPPLKIGHIKSSRIINQNSIKQALYVCGGGGVAE